MNAPKDSLPITSEGCSPTEGRPRVSVLAWVSQRNPIVKQAADSGIDLVLLDSLKGAACYQAKCSVNLLRDSPPAGTFWDEGGRSNCMVVVDQDLKEVDMALLSGLVMSHAALLVGPKAANAFTWELKTEANARGRIFEIAESPGTFRKLFASSFWAWERRVLTERSTTEPPVEVMSRLSAECEAPAPTLQVDHYHPELYSERGRFDAERIRGLLTLSRARLAHLTEVQPETIRRTPDSEQLQTKLRPFARVAQVAQLHADRARFLAWLNSPLSELGQKSPLEELSAGRFTRITKLADRLLAERNRGERAQVAEALTRFVSQPHDITNPSWMQDLKARGIPLHGTTDADPAKISHRESTPGPRPST